MTRRKPRERWTAREIIADVTAWADRQGFFNVADELRRACAQLDKEAELADANRSSRGPR
jgi:hypothetical protein